MNMNIANWLDDAGQRCPERPALFEGQRQVANYGAFVALVRHRAAYLVNEHGIVPGDRVALFMKNCCEYLELLYAIWWVGAVAVPINCKLHPVEAGWIVENAQARLIFTDGGQVFAPDTPLQGCRELDREDMGELTSIASTLLLTPCPRQADDLAWLFYTSGTTGRSKGVMLSHGNLTAMSLCYPLDVDPVSAEDAVVYAAPMSHGAGLYNFIHVRRAARHVVPESRGFKADELFGLANWLGNVSVFAAPTMLKRMVEQARRQGYSGEGIKTIVYGGAPMYQADLKEALKTFGPRLVQIYGQGESPMTISALSRQVIADRKHPEWATLAASVGRAQSCVEISTLAPAHRPLPVGQMGEIAVRGPTVMQGYWRNEAATRQTLVEGWLLTGDVGFVDEAGYLTLKDRSKDVIISGGTNIYPREVEEVLLRHLAVQEVSVIGVPDPEWGESVTAFVVRRADASVDEAALNALCIASIARFKRPKHYVFVPQLPKNSYGKVLKTELRLWLKTSANDTLVP